MTATGRGARPQSASEPEPSRGHDLGLQVAPYLFVLLWSTGFIGAKLGAPYAEPFTFLTLRFAIAAALFLAIVLLARADWPGPIAAFHSLVAGVLIHGCYLGATFWAIDLGMPAGVSALIFGLQPLMTAVLAGLLLAEEVTLRHWLGLALGLGGVVLVIAPKLDLAGSGITPFTVGISVAGVLCITLGALYQKRFGAGADLRTGGLFQYLGALAVCGLAALLVETGEVAWTGEFIFALAWLVLVLSVGAVALLMLLIRHGAVSRTATVFYLVAPTTALIGWAMFGETLNSVQIAGMGLAVAGVALAGPRWREGRA